MSAVVIRKVIIEAVAICALAFVPTAVMSFYHPHRPNWSPEALQEGEVRLTTAIQWQGLLWVDARTPREYAKGHIPGAVLLNEDAWHELLPEFLKQWQPDLKVVVYCDSVTCRASSSVADRLRNEMGLESVYVLKDGWEAWQDASQ